MEINQEIITTLKKASIPVDEALLYLMTIHFKLSDKLIPSRIKQFIHALGIVKDIEGTIVWDMPLFVTKGTSLIKDFSWVEKEYIPLFKDINPVKHKSTSECIKRMKKFMTENPVTKEEILEATQLHIHETDSRYIKQSDYFIEKGSGKVRESFLKTYLEKVKELNEASKSRTQEKFIAQ